MISPVEKTATCCWNPFNAKRSLFACGTVAGALDASFDSSTELEIYEQTQGRMQKVAGINSAYRFCKLAWTSSTTGSNGMLAGGLEGGMLHVWNVDSLLELAGSNQSQVTEYSEEAQSNSALVFAKKAHEGLVKGLAWNPVQQNVLASASSAADIAIWDLKAGKSVAPGPKSNALTSISDLAWNPQVQHIMATSSNSGSLVIWDLKSKREVIQMSIPNRLSISCIAWNPEVPTQILAACEDDSQPFIYGWDVRNAHAPEKCLQHNSHQRGILSMSWCAKDAEMLATAGKDNTVLLWNPKTAQKTGELPSSDNWIFDVKFCPRNPDLLSAASFDGKIRFWSLQEQNNNTFGSESTSNVSESCAFPTGTGSMNAQTESCTSKKAPRWLKRPVGCSLAFSGQLFCFSSSAPSSITYKTVPEDRDFYNTVQELERALEQPQSLLPAYAAARASNLDTVNHAQDIDSYWFMLSVALDSSRKPLLLRLLGLAKEELRDRLRKLSLSSQELSPEPEDLSSSRENHSPLSPTQPKPHSEGEFSKFITQSIIVGDFDSAVQYCRHADKWADALILAHCGGESLLEKTREKFVQKYAAQASYLSLANHILTRDLSGVIQSAALSEWQEILALLVTFTSNGHEHAEANEFSSLLSQLATRLAEEAKNYFAAVCCFAAAGNLAGVVQFLSKASPDILPEDFVQFLMALNAVAGVESQPTNQLFNGTALSAEQKEALMQQLAIYSKLLHREGLVRAAFKYAQLSTVPTDEQFVYRLAVLCGASVEVAGEVVQVASGEPVESLSGSYAQQGGYATQPIGAYSQPIGAYSQPIQPSGTYSQPIQPSGTYSQPIQQSTYSQPSQQTTYSQPGQQTAFAQPGQQSTYGRPIQQQFVPQQPTSFAPPPPFISNPLQSQFTQPIAPIQSQQQQHHHQPQGASRVPATQTAWNDAPMIDIPQSRPSPKVVTQPSPLPAPVNPPIQAPVPAVPVVQRSPIVAPPPPPPVIPIQRSMATGQSNLTNPNVSSTNQGGMQSGGFPQAVQTAYSQGGAHPAPVPVQKVASPQVPVQKVAPSQVPVPIPTHPQVPVQASPQVPIQQLPGQPARQVQLAAQQQQNPLPSAQPRLIDAKLQQSLVAPLKGLLQLCKSKAPPTQARLIDDSEKRLSAFFEKLSNPSSLPSAPVLEQTTQLCIHVARASWDEALALQASLYASHYDEVGQWMVGVKRLIELARKL
jgi:protein transport protein SEC31